MWQCNGNLLESQGNDDWWSNAHANVIFWSHDHDDGCASQLHVTLFQMDFAMPDFLASKSFAISGCKGFDPLLTSLAEAFTHVHGRGTDLRKQNHQRGSACVFIGGW
jgi:hypothetical protein